jgi:hypothetical protein
MIRALLIWLLVVALPAQGAMAATMAFCGPNHHERAAAVAASHHAGAAQSHPAAADHHDESALASETVALGKFAQSDLQKCSVCAACCSAAAMHDATPRLPELEPAHADFAPVKPVVEPFSADGPDRPPRRLVA